MPKSEAARVNVIASRYRFITRSSGKVVQPTRVMVPVAEHEGFLGLMPAYTGASLGVKLVAFYPQNQGIPTHHATILLFKPETGEPLVSMDGRLVTEVYAPPRYRRSPRSISLGRRRRCWR